MSKDHYALAFWLILVLAITNIYISIATEKISRYAFYNSDALYIPALYRDLFSQYSIFGWTPPSVPYFFPDIPLYFIINFLVGNFHWAIVLYGIVQSLLWIIGVIHLSNKIFTPRKSIQALIVFGGIVLFLLFSVGKCPAFLPMFLSEYHFGAALILIFSLSLVVQILKCGVNTNKTVRSYIALFILSTLTIASDAIYVVQFLMPVLLSLLLLFLVSMISTKHLLYLYISLTPSIPIAGWIGRSLLIFRKSQPHHKITLAEIIARALRASREILQWAENLWFSHTLLLIFQIVWIAFVVISLILLFLSLRKALKERATRLKDANAMVVAGLFVLGISAIVAFHVIGGAEWIFWVAFLLVSILVWGLSIKHPAKTHDEKTRDAGFTLFVSFFLFSMIINIASALFVGGSEPRYFLPTMLFPLFFGWPFLIARYKRILLFFDNRYAMSALVVSVFLLSFWLGVLPNFKNISALSNLGDYYPDLVKCLDENAKARNLHNGLSQYWYAKYITMLSKSNLHVVQVVQAGGGLFFDHWINNLNWYNNDFEFVIADEIGMRAIYESFIVGGFGKPAETFSCEGKKVLVYNRKEDVNFQTQFRKFFSFEFYASELFSETGRVVGLSRIAEEESSQKGYLTYGPYVNLMIGDYAFEISYYAKKSDDTDVGRWDIIIRSPNNAKSERVAKGVIEKEGEHVISGVFKIRENDLKMEVRTYYKGRGTLRVDKITIRRIR
jgi:hypothetical protein